MVARRTANGLPPGMIAEAATPLTGLEKGRTQ